MKLNNKVTPAIQFIFIIISTLSGYGLYKCSSFFDKIHPDLLFIIPIPGIFAIYKLLRRWFDKHLRKAKCLSYFIDSHNVNGIWSGKGASQHKKTKFNVKLEIKQTYSHIEIKGVFDKSVSHSIGAEWNKEGDSYYLLYTYNNSPVAERVNGMNMHIGCIKLFYINNGDKELLKGIYFNSPERETRGEIEVKKL